MKKWQIISLILILLGLLDSAYLTYIHYAPEQLTCSIKRGCDIVNLSKYATLWGIPVAAYGIFFYLVGGFIIVNKQRFLLAWTIIGLLVSAYLTYLEAFVIKAWCQWCLVSAIIIILLFILALVNTRKNYDLSI